MTPPLIICSLAPGGVPVPAECSIVRQSQAAAQKLVWTCSWCGARVKVVA